MRVLTSALILSAGAALVAADGTKKGDIPAYKKADNSTLGFCDYEDTCR